MRSNETLMGELGRKRGSVNGSSGRLGLNASLVRLGPVLERGLVWGRGGTR